MSVYCAIFRLIFALACIFTKPVFTYVLPDPTFEVLIPRGLRVSIPDAPGLRIFGFHANINKEIRSTEFGDIAGDVFLARNDRWTFQNSAARISNGDVINYWIYAQVNGENYKKEDQTWTYNQRANQESMSNIESHLAANQMSTDGQLIFEDNFDTFNESLWSRELKMPLSPDYEFCVYHNQNHQMLVQINDGQLLLTPIILEDYYGENATAYGKLQLNGCTSNVPMECSRRAVSFSILPPVISVRLTTRHFFSFRYGKIEIRAKFPQGDWLYPEMWLEPKYMTYGPNYASGRVLLGQTRGNENLVNATDPSIIYDSRRLDFGVRMGMSPSIQERLVSKILESGPKWTQNFHVYTTVWNNNGFRFLVDGEEIGHVGPSLLGWVPGAYNGKKRTAPFDQEFYITLGVGAGGVRVFPDGTKSAEYPKPWSNKNPKAMLHFWNARNQWLPSWTRDGGKKISFAIDYIRVWSF
ncbi:beta-1,3-glucan-binding protein [Harpegnathos saltator]|uniref:Beta-1,3-glucan-binding protein n=1 Tax=Harpegnathos saltator TaxID=610380 RepID=E2BFR2_HARSA|nr:beta-1,3-glucan-binding protein [Harpegnathos saltator]EFN85450.1 Beta-1,3-glucan-binding protein [Harpegnathos saltator]